jgi:hypothetical protein
MGQDIDTLQKTEKVMNIMDMSNPSEIFLLDEYSDATEFGGLSESKMLHNVKDGYLRLQAQFIRERQGLQMIEKVMFCGFTNSYLLKQEYDMYNGLRIVMRPP